MVIQARCGLTAQEMVIKIEVATYNPLIHIPRFSQLVSGGFRNIHDNLRVADKVDSVPEGDVLGSVLVAFNWRNCATCWGHGFAAGLCRWGMEPDSDACCAENDRVKSAPG